MKKYNYLLILSLLFVPVTVFASQGSDISGAFGALLMEAFVSIHMSLFVLRPLSEIISPDNSKKTFWILFAIRAGILIFFDFFVTPGIAVFDFVAVFIGAFILIPVSALIAKKKGNTASFVPLTTRTPVVTQETTEIHCGKCGGILQVTDKFCQNCGAPFDDSAKVVAVKGKTPVYVEAKSFDPVFNNSEKVVVEEFIKKELAKAGIDEKTKLIPENVLMRKNILNVIFGVLVYVYISLIFFHFPMYTYVLGLIILIVFLLLTRNFKLLSYLSKEIKSRPSEKISNIVMSMKNSLVKDTSRMIKLIIVLVAIGASLFTFKDPVILYEKMDGGYGVRYYAFGLSNYKTVTIPDSHKGEPVISIRGNGFSNMFFLEEATLPDTITEIRGQAFLNDSKLTRVKLPSNLVSLGGAAFKNCISLEEVELPSTLTYLGGEAFYEAINLKSIVLPAGLEEIRGDTFYDCKSLTSVVIPDSVTRIGGHAFHYCSSLNNVSISPKSKLTEIGSSAFRECDSLYEIYLPKGISVNERAFKNSPTRIYYYQDVVVNTNNNVDNSINNTMDDFYSTYSEKPIVYNSSESFYNETLTDAKVTSSNEYVLNKGEKVFFDKYSLVVVIESDETNSDNYLISAVAPKQRIKPFVYNKDSETNYLFYKGTRIEFNIEQFSKRLIIKVQNKDELKSKFVYNKELELQKTSWVDIDSSKKYRIKYDSFHYNFGHSFFFAVDDYTSSNYIIIRKLEGIYTINDDLMIELTEYTDRELVDLEDSNITVKIYYN